MKLSIHSKTAMGYRGNTDVLICVQGYAWFRNNCWILTSFEVEYTKLAVTVHPWVQVILSPVRPWLQGSLYKFLLRVLPQSSLSWQTREHFCKNKKENQTYVGVFWEKLLRISEAVWDDFRSHVARDLFVDSEKELQVIFTAPLLLES